MEILEQLKNDLGKLSIPCKKPHTLWIPTFYNKPIAKERNYIRIGKLGTNSYYCIFNNASSNENFCLEYVTSEYHELLSDVLNFYCESIETP